MFVADHMPVLLAHLGSQELAGECVTEMLAKNTELQVCLND
jgi:dihydroxyacetone kinase DhaKLM complex PTS-EIIA-like component DhaM